MGLPTIGGGRSVGLCCEEVDKTTEDRRHCVYSSQLGDFGTSVALLLVAVWRTLTAPKRND